MHACLCGGGGAGGMCMCMCVCVCVCVCVYAGTAWVTSKVLMRICSPHSKRGPSFDF